MLRLGPLLLALQLLSSAFSLAAPAAAPNKLLIAAAAAADGQDWTNARTLFRKAADQAKRNGNKDDRQAALAGLVKALSALQDYAGALAAGKELAALTNGGQALLDAAVLAVDAHQLGPAAGLLAQADQAFAKSSDPAGRGKAAYYLAIVEQRRGHFDEELAAYGRSRAFSMEAGDAREAARRLLDIGNVYKEFVPNFTKALAAYDAATQELDVLHADQDILDVAIDKGNLLMAAGRTEDAVALLERVRTSISHDDARAWIRVTQILANAQYRRGTYDVARGLLGELRTALPRLPSAAGRAPYAVDADNLDALIAAELGTIDAAVRGFEGALATAKQFDLKAKQSIVLNNLGYWLREAGRAPEALPRLAEALRLDQSLKADESIAYDQRNLGLALLDAGKLADAKAQLDAALETSTELGLAHNAAWCYVGQAAAALASGDTKAAESAFHKGYEAAGAAELPDLQWRAAAGLARAYLKEGDSDQGFGAFETALVSIDALEDSLGSDAARRGFKTRAGVAQVYKDYIQALLAANRQMDAERVRRRAEPRAVAHINNVTK